MSALDKYKLNTQIIENLRLDSISNLFPVQEALIPFLLQNNSADCIFPKDVCVSAPTGSGKTLSYVIPIIQVLQRPSVAVRLRALVLLPSRELANQVYHVFIKVAAQTGLKIGLSTGQNSLEEDQRAIVGMDSDVGVSNPLFMNAHGSLPEPGPMGRSLVDILVCTPGRLQDHVQYSTGFTLQHLRFLVLDEADRLLGNAYHSWVRTIVRGSTQNNQKLDISEQIRENESDIFSHLFVHQRPLQRLLFSATMTDNPRKLALLNINKPMIFKIGRDGENTEQTDVQMSTDIVLPDDEGMSGLKKAGTSSDIQYILPSTLKEYICVCDTAKRPLVLLAILAEAFGLTPSLKHDIGLGKSRSICIIFVGSVDSTHRLSRLLQLVNRQDETSEDLFFQGKVAEMSRSVDSANRKRIVDECAAGSVRILVSSDHMSRGIDLPTVGLVINYDPPKQAKNYVHRVGRTARANREGHAITMLKVGQTGSFKKVRSVIALGQDVTMDKISARAASEEFVAAMYTGALKRLQRVFLSEEEGQLRPSDELTPGVLTA